MATTGRTATAETDEAGLAATLREAAVVHLVSHADGDALAAAGLLARALPADTPYQVSTARTRDAADRRIATSTATTISLGFQTDDADDGLDGDAMAHVAYDVASDLEGADPVLALAGGLAAGVSPRDELLEAATTAGVERRPGVGIPTADLADGLAHTTLLHGAVSGDEHQAGAFLAELDLPAEMDADAHRRVASALAMDVTESPAPSSAVAALGRALHPHVLPDGPVATLEGFADVLESLARSAPGLGAALAVGQYDRTDVLDAWRDHAEDVHEAVRLGDRTRHDGFVVFETKRADPWSVARLVRDFRAAEPMVLVVGADDVALATTEENARERLESLDAVSAATGRERLASARVDATAAELATSLEEEP